jgi:hypothetical protein
MSRLAKVFKLNRKGVNVAIAVAPAGIVCVGLT